MKDLTDTDPHWLKSARAFVVDLTPQQVQAIAQSPLIQAIRRNRRLG